MFHMMGLYYLLQTEEELLFLLVLLLYFTVLLFEYFSVVLRNIGEGRRRYDNAEEKMKTFFSIYILLT